MAALRLSSYQDRPITLTTNLIFITCFFCLSQMHTRSLAVAIVVGVVDSVVSLDACDNKQQPTCVQTEGVM